MWWNVKRRHPISGFDSNLFGQVAIIFLDLFSWHNMEIIMLKLLRIYEITEYKVHPRRRQLFLFIIVYTIHYENHNSLLCSSLGITEINWDFLLSRYLSVQVFPSSMFSSSILWLCLLQFLLLQLFLLSVAPPIVI